MPAFIRCSRRRDQLRMRARRAWASSFGNTNAIVDNPRPTWMIVRGIRHSRRSVGNSQRAANGARERARAMVARLSCRALIRSRLPWHFAERVAVPRSHQVLIECVVLAAAARNLDRTHHRGEVACRLAIPVLGDAMEQACAIGIAAAGRIDDRRRPDGGNRVSRAVGVNDRAFAAQRHAHRLDAIGEIADRQAGSLRQHVRLVVVDGQVVRETDHFRELVSAEQRQSLPRIEDERDAERREPPGVLLHAFLAVG